LLKEPAVLMGAAPYQVTNEAILEHLDTDDMDVFVALSKMPNAESETLDKIADRALSFKENYHGPRYHVLENIAKASKTNHETHRKLINDEQYGHALAREIITEQETSAENGKLILEKYGADRQILKGLLYHMPTRGMKEVHERYLAQDPGE